MILNYMTKKLRKEALKKKNPGYKLAVFDLLNVIFLQN